MRSPERLGRRRAAEIALLLGITLAVGCGGADAPIPGLPPARADRPPPAPLPGWRSMAIDALLDARVALGHRSGYVALIARDGRLVHAKTAGRADLEEDLPMAMDTRFQIASMTKPITAVAAMILVEEGRLSLDDPVAKFLPEIGRLPVALLDEEGALIGSRPATETMRIRHLLSFSSGIGGASFDRTPFARRWRDEGLYEATGDLGARIASLARLPLLEGPGTRWRYGFDLDAMARIVERVAEEPFAAFVERRILSPLGMHATRYLRDTPPGAPLARMYTQDADGELVRVPESEWKARDWTPGGSGIVSTAMDYMRFALMLWNEGEYDGVRILSPETVRQMREPEVPSGVLASMDIGGLGFGLGVSVVTDSDETPMATRPGDFWWSGAHGTHFWVSPETGIVLVVMQQNAMGEHAAPPVAPFLVQQLALIDR